MAFRPFIMEWVFGGKTAKQAFAESRRYTILKLVVLILSVMCLWLAFRTVSMGMEISDYRARIRKIERTCNDSSDSAVAERVVTDMQNINRYLQCRETEVDCD